MPGKAYRTNPGDGGDGRTGEIHNVPGIMTEIKLSRKIEKLRRDRDKCQNSLEQEVARVNDKGILAGNATIKILRAALETKEAELEETIEEMVLLSKGDKS